MHTSTQMRLFATTAALTFKPNRNRLYSLRSVSDGAHRRDILHGQQGPIRVIKNQAPGPPGVQDRDDTAGCRPEQISQIRLAEAVCQPYPLLCRAAVAFRKIQNLPRQADFQALKRGVLEQLKRS